MHNRTAHTVERFHSTSNEMFSCLGEHLNSDILRDMSMLDEGTHEIIIGLGRGGKGDLNFLEADIHQHVEHAHFSLGIHGFEQRLIAIAQISAHPHRRLGNDPVRPGAILERDGRERTVFRIRMIQHFGYSKVFCRR